MTTYHSEVLRLRDSLQEAGVCPVCGAPCGWVATPVALAELNAFCAGGHHWAVPIDRRPDGSPVLGHVRACVE